MSTADREAARWEGYTARELQKRWDVPALHLFESVGSTNDVARHLAEIGAPAGTVVLADEQLAGRGRSGRAWSSPAGLGLWMSLVLRPDRSANAEIFPLLVGLTAADVLDEVVHAAISLKWPNDLLIGGRKVAGILCEGAWSAERPSFLIVGLGVNVSHRAEDFPTDIRPQATSLRIATGRAPAREPIAADLVSDILAALKRPPADLAGFSAELEARDSLRGNEVSVTEPSTGAERARGTALGIAPDGALLLRTATGTIQPIRSGTVRLLEASAVAQANHNQI